MKETDDVMCESGVSVITPFLNEEDGILTFCQTIDDYAGSLPFPLELVFVDDGSTDGTVDKLLGYSFKRVQSVKLICLSHNFGSHAAIRAGLTQATYDICTWMGADSASTRA